jgi:hypothetical protein
MPGNEPLSDDDFVLLREKDPKEAVETLIEHYRYLRDSVHGDYPGKGHPDSDFLRARMRYLTYYRDEGYSIEKLCRLMKVEPTQVQLLLMTWDADNPPKPKDLSGERWWISWYELGDDPKTNPSGVVAFYCTGFRVVDDAATICAVVDASSEEAAREIVRKGWPGASDKEWRFVSARPRGWLPSSERFKP